MDFQDFLDTPLEHAGVKGMKWGRRKAKTPASNVSAKMTGRTQRKGIATRNTATLVGLLAGSFLMPGVGTIAGGVGGRVYTNTANKTRVKALMANPSGKLDRKSAKKAIKTMRKYSNIEVTVNGKTKVFD